MSNFEKKLPTGERPPVRIVGDAPESVKELLSQHVSSHFGEGHLDQLTEKQIQEISALEYEKKPYEQEFITSANEITNTLLSESGLAPYDVSEKNLHYVPVGLFNKLGGGAPEAAAATFYSKQLILLDANQVRVSIPRNAATLLHEILHLKSHIALEAYPTEDNPNEYKHGTHRGGIAVHATAKKVDQKNISFKAFSGLNEAVVAAIEKRYTPELLSRSTNLEVRADVLRLSDLETLALMAEAAKKKDKLTDEISWISPDGKDVTQYPYFEQRRVLDFIIQCAQEDGLVNSYDEGLAIFVEAHFTGHLLSITKLIGKTIDESAFELLGVMDDGNSAQYILDRLQKKRRLKKSKDIVE